MCCLFGFYNYGGKIKNLSRLTNLLADNATERGIDASGIAYKDGNGKHSFLDTYDKVDDK